MRKETRNFLLNLKKHEIFKKHNAISFTSN